jgi:hypothetical protein
MSNDNTSQIRFGNGTFGPSQYGTGGDPKISRDPVALDDEAIEAAFNCNDSQSLDEFVNHPSEHVRATAATNPVLSDEQARRLVDDPSPMVRFELADRGDPKINDLLAGDSSPIVLRHLLRFPLSNEQRERILSDPEVREMEMLVRAS